MRTSQELWQTHLFRSNKTREQAVLRPIFLPGTGTFFSKNAVVSSLFDGISTRRIVQPFAERTDRHWMFYLSNKISSLARYFLPWTGTFFRMRPHPKSRMRESRTSGSVRGVPCERYVYSTTVLHSTR